MKLVASLEEDVDIVWVASLCLRPHGCTASFNIFDVYSEERGPYTVDIVMHIAFLIITWQGLFLWVGGGRRGVLVTYIYLLNEYILQFFGYANPF